MERWTGGEITVLRANQHLLSPYQLSFVITSRTPQQIAQRLSAKRWSWTVGEISYLISHGAILPDSVIGRKLGRTTDAVKCKKSELGILKMDPTLYERIPVELEPRPRSPRFAEVPVHPDENGHSQVLMMFLSRLDEYDVETLDKVRTALNDAQKGRELIEELAP